MNKYIKHLAIIMDGNGRWAKAKKLSRSEGHKAGVIAVKNIVESCVRLKINYLTLYTFSNENWNRPKKETIFLIELLIKTLDKELELLINNKIKFNVLGNFNKLDMFTRRKLRKVEKRTADFTNMHLNLAISYSGREEIIFAINKILKKDMLSINEEDFSKYLYTSFLPDPDLLIRTGGEFRISNFLLWQIAYSELYFTKTLWPDFNSIELDKAINSFNKRERRFGKTSEQM